MTSGEDSGTSGERSWRPGPWLTIALIGAVVAIVNASSGILEMTKAGLDFHWSEPILWELTSAIVIIGCAPLVGWAVRRWPPQRDNLLRFGLTHLALTVPFALIHIAAIFVMRESAYWAVGAHYGFFDDGVAITILYEWRKDVLTYGAIAFTYWLHDYLDARRAPAPPLSNDRIEVRDGGAAVFLAPADILFLEAAGNYVEFHTLFRTHLVRGTLAAWEARLAQRGFARIHRARLVNRAHIAAIKPTPSGDVELTLADGRTLSGSRRYRAALETNATLGTS